VAPAKAQLTGDAGKKTADFAHSNTHDFDVTELG
jgi:hypothetical protein